MKLILGLFLALALVMQDTECATISDITTGVVGKFMLNNVQIIKVNYPPTFQQDLIKAGINLLSGNKMIVLPLLTTDIPGGSGAYIAFTLYVPIDDNPIPVNNIAGGVSNVIFGK
jgi:hypothetical protein